MSHAAFPALKARSQDTANTEGIIINISGTYKDTTIPSTEPNDPKIDRVDSTVCIP